MQRGRKPKPVAQLKLEGTYDGSRHRRRQCEPAAEGDLADVDPPAWLTAEQKRAWRQTIKDAPKGVLKRADRQLFLSYVVAVARFELAVRTQNQLDAAGTTPLLTRSSTGTAMLSPYLRAMNQASALMVQLGAELGFSTSARARLGQPAEREPQDDPVWSTLRKFPVISSGRK
jgi:P27 family predicted phage terminase small subunit